MVIGFPREVSFSRFLLLVLFGGILYGFIAGALGPDKWDWEKGTLLITLVIGLLIIFFAPNEYLEEHIWKHMLKRHLLKVFLWTFVILFLLEGTMRFMDFEGFARTRLNWVFVLAVLLGLIPESGPHILFVIMYSKGLIPFSVLLTNCIVQDGHGMLPLLAYSVKDSVLIKILNVVFGLIVGLPLFLLGY